MSILVKSRIDLLSQREISVSRLGGLFIGEITHPGGLMFSMILFKKVYFSRATNCTMSAYGFAYLVSLETI